MNKLKNEKPSKITEQNVNLIMIAYIVCFIFSWTPYAIVSFYAAFLGHDLSPLAGTLPAMFAKSEFLWSSLVFIWSNRLVRTKLRDFLGLNQQSNQANQCERILQGKNYKYNIEDVHSGVVTLRPAHKSFCFLKTHIN